MYRISVIQKFPQEKVTDIFHAVAQLAECFSLSTGVKYCQLGTSRPRTRQTFRFPAPGRGARSRPGSTVKMFFNSFRPIIDCFDRRCHELGQRCPRSGSVSHGEKYDVDGRHQVLTEWKHIKYRFLPWDTLPDGPDLH